jgi:hypothetical protein
LKLVLGACFEIVWSNDWPQLSSIDTTCDMFVE